VKSAREGQQDSDVVGSSQRVEGAAQRAAHNRRREFHKELHNNYMIIKFKKCGSAGEERNISRDLVVRK